MSQVLLLHRLDLDTFDELQLRQRPHLRPHPRCSAFTCYYGAGYCAKTVDERPLRLRLHTLSYACNGRGCFHLYCAHQLARTL